MRFVETTAKTVEDAVAAALKQLSTTRDEVEVEIIDAPTKGLFGIGAKPAKVKVSINHNLETVAVSFLKQVTSAMGLSVDIEANTNNKDMDITLAGEHMGVLIGKRGQTLDALQYLTRLATNKGDAPFVNITLDSENYREKRKATLETLALSIGRKVKATKKAVTLEPMNTSDRRIIHSALEGDRALVTHSQGNEPYRNVVIAPKR
ncbi:MAG: protein jag [Defluviitaleaceae bacterium]|nr:protein jag [Defluviitaleaceae bacterium]